MHFVGLYLVILKSAQVHHTQLFDSSLQRTSHELLSCPIVTKTTTQHSRVHNLVVQGDKTCAGCPSIDRENCSSNPPRFISRQKSNGAGNIPRVALGSQNAAIASGFSHFLGHATAGIVYHRGIDHSCSNVRWGKCGGESGDLPGHTQLTLMPSWP